MKIAIDCHTLEIEKWAGKETVLFELVKALSGLDKENEYFLYFRRPVDLKISLPENFTIINLPLPTPVWQFAVIASLLSRRVERILVPCTYLLPAINIFVPNVIIIHDTTTLLPDISQTHKKMTRWKERLLLGAAIRNSWRVITVSDNTQKDLQNFFPVSNEKLVTIYPGKSDIYRPIEITECRERLEKYHLPQKFILFVGTLEPRKNIKSLLSAFKKYVDEAVDHETALVIVGQKGWFYEEIFKLVSDLGLDDRVIFTGYVSEEDLPFFYNAAVCLVYPSLYEGFGLPPLEAMACGTPVVTSNISSIPEVVGEAGILIDPRSVEAIKDAIKVLTKDEIVREQHRRASLERALFFGWDKMARAVSDLLSEK